MYIATLFCCTFNRKKPRGYSRHCDWVSWRKDSRYLPCSLAFSSQFSSGHWLCVSLTHTGLIIHLIWTTMSAIWQFFSLQCFYFIEHYLECSCERDIFKSQLQWVTSYIFPFLRLRPQQSFFPLVKWIVFLWSPVQTHLFELFSPP